MIKFNFNWMIVLFLMHIMYLAKAQVIPDTLTSESKLIVKMLNGDEFNGTFLSQDSIHLLLNTENGELKLLKSRIKAIEEDTNQGKFTFANPNDTRYFFGPTGIPLGKGKGYYQNILVSSNFINYGISKNFSIGGGFEFLTLMQGEPLWFFTPKLGFNIGPKFHLSGGLMLMGLASEGTFALPYAASTFGSSEHNFTLGLGFGYSEGELSKNPAIMFSGMTRASKSLCFLTENYFIPASGELIFFGVQGIRILARKNAFDIGIVLSPEFGDFVKALPYVGYVRVF